MKKSYFPHEEGILISSFFIITSQQQQQTPKNKKLNAKLDFK